MTNKLSNELNFVAFQLTFKALAQEQYQKIAQGQHSQENNIAWGEAECYIKFKNKPQCFLFMLHLQQCFIWFIALAGLCAQTV